MGLQHQVEYNKRLKEQHAADARNAAPKPTTSELKAQIEAIPAKKQRAAAKIENGLKEALAVVRGEAEPHQTITPTAKRGRPKTGAAKELLALKIDGDLLVRIKATPGWQRKVEDLLAGNFG